MTFMDLERETLNRLLPGLDEALSAMTLFEREAPDSSKAIQHFRDSGGPGLLVPERHLGLGATAIDSIRVLRAIGSRAPSLAVATTMHHFSIASLVEAEKAEDPRVWMLLEAIATQKLLVASGFAEGRTGQSILTPTVDVELQDNAVVLNGCKRPCSLSTSMDLMTVSIVVPKEDGTQEFSVAIVPANSPGMSVQPFWSNSILSGTESNEVTMKNVQVPLDLVVRTGVVGGELDPVQTAGFIWFELLMSASYLGVGSALVERVLKSGKASTQNYVDLVVELEGAMNALSGVAARIDGDEPRNKTMLLSTLFARYACQDTLTRATQLAVEILGGTEFMSSHETTYLAACVTALKFHPPSRMRSAENIRAALEGEPLILV